MAGNITYADLRFARGPPEKNQWEEPNEGELTYENLQGPRGPETEGVVCGSPQNTPELSWWSTCCHHWRLVTNRPKLGALVIFLFLLATNIALGFQYLQTTKQLQQASQDHAARNHILEERIHLLQAGLEESQQLLRLIEEEHNSTKKELRSTLVALWQSQVAENRTQRLLWHQELLLDQANHSLALLQSYRVDLETNLSQATSCKQIGCCRPGWTLFRWRCLWLSNEQKTWEDSRKHCEWRSSRLLVLPEPWMARELWDVIGQQLTKRKKAICADVDFGASSVVSFEHSRSEALSSRNYNNYVAMHNGELSAERSSRTFRFICEIAASPEKPQPRDGLLSDF